MKTVTVTAFRVEYQAIVSSAIDPRVPATRCSDAVGKLKLAMRLEVDIAGLSNAVWRTLSYSSSAFSLDLLALTSPTTCFCISSASCHLLIRGPCSETRSDVSVSQTDPSSIVC